MTEAARYALLPRLGVAPPVRTLVHDALDEALTTAEARSPGAVAALDAGCGRVSALHQFRGRITRLVGADIHGPSTPLPHLDEFAVVDLCAAAGAFPDGTFDVVLSSFTLEHFADPPAALRNLGRWLRPGGTLVTDIRLVTVGHLARAWGRHLPTFGLGLMGDLLTRSAPSRRSTIVVSATAGPGAG